MLRELIARHTETVGSDTAHPVNVGGEHPLAPHHQPLEGWRQHRAGQCPDLRADYRSDT
jgi:hypothetical protein